MSTRGAVTWSVAELHDAVGGMLEHVFGSTVWVSGQLSSISRSRQGHTYFDLVDPESDGGRDEPRLSVTLFDGYRQKVNNVIRRHGEAMRMEDGTVVRICGELTTYPARSRLQLVMTGIDPTFTLAVAQQRRDMALAALSAAGLLERNGRLRVPRPPLHVAVVTSSGSAAESDVLHELRASGIGFRVRAIDARTQGALAEQMLVTALQEAARLEVDVVLLVRGGGAKADLAAFDTEELGRAIAAMPVPVLTGIGHEVDRSIADEVAHTAYKTPTAAADAVVDMVLDAARELDTAATSVAVAATGRLGRAGTRLDTTAHTTAVACRGHLARESAMLSGRSRRLADTAPRALARAGERLDATASSLGAAGIKRLDRATQRVDTLASLVAARDPSRALAAGWSITRTADGRLVRGPADAPAGTRIVTTVAGGPIPSVVQEADAASGVEPAGSGDEGSPRQ